MVQIRIIEEIATLTLEAEFDDIGTVSDSLEAAHPVSHKRFERNPSPFPKI
jgi:hypothetical protein